MKVCLHSVSYSGTVTPDQAALPLEAVMRKAAQLGFEGITLAAKRPHALPLDLSAEDRRRIVETAAELQEEWVAGARRVGVTAGASTPDREIEATIARLRDICGARDGR